MSTLRFPIGDVLEQMRHALESKEHRTLYGQEEGHPALHLVKDEGIYLMSSGLPRMLVAPDSTSSKVVYAEGYDPRSADVWDACREAVGGDDFIEELLEVTPEAIKEFEASVGKFVVIDVTDQEFRVSLEVLKQ